MEGIAGVILFFLWTGLIIGGGLWIIFVYGPRMERQLKIAKTPPATTPSCISQHDSCESKFRMKLADFQIILERNTIKNEFRKE